MKYIRVHILVNLLFLATFYLYYKIFESFNICMPCFFYETTGFYCPGCGITRMFFSILNFDFYQAFRYNPFVFILLIMYIIYVVMRIILKKEIVLSKKSYYILLVSAMAFGILRNIDIFSFLAPTVV